jgi:hypothetical protein
MSGGLIAAIVAGATVAALLIVAGFLVALRVIEAAPAAIGTGTPSPSRTVGEFPIPEVGRCYDTHEGSEFFNPDAQAEVPISCADQHTMETIGSGLVEGDTRPSIASDLSRGLYAECGRAADEFLGTSFRTTYTAVVLSVPGISAWQAGARWYRCDLIATDALFGSAAIPVTGSLRGRAEPITCLGYDFVTDTFGNTLVENIAKSACDVPHNGEVAGAVLIFDLDRSDRADFEERLNELCRPIARDFLDVSSIPGDLIYWPTWPTNPDSLDQYALCVVEPADVDRRLRGSLRGIGNDPIPWA